MLQLRLLSLALLFVFTATTICQADTLNSKAAAFLATKVGIRVGGGECAHVATEALRVAGAEFISTDLGGDYPVSGDYVWGTLVKQVSVSSNRWTDSSPSANVLPGDVIQYRNVTLTYTTPLAHAPTSTLAVGSMIYSGGSTTSTAAHHTSVVAAVNTAGMPTSVYEENVNGVRTLAKHSIDLTKMTAGYVRIYRPIARKDRAGYYKFTLVNNTTSSKSYTVKNGTWSSSSSSIGVANTASSYQTYVYSWSIPSSKFSLYLSNMNWVTLDNAGGYEIYTSGSSYYVHKLSP